MVFAFIFQTLLLHEPTDPLSVTGSLMIAMWGLIALVKDSGSEKSDQKNEATVPQMMLNRRNSFELEHAIRSSIVTESAVFELDVLWFQLPRLLGNGHGCRRHDEKCIVSAPRRSAESGGDDVPSNWIDVSLCREEHVQHVLSFEARMKCSVSCPEINSSLLLIFRLDFLLKACMDLA